MQTTNPIVRIALVFVVMISGAACRKTNYAPIGGVDFTTDSESTEGSDHSTEQDTTAKATDDTDSEFDTNFNSDSDSYSDFQTDTIDTSEDTNTDLTPDSETVTETTTDIEAESGCFSVGNGMRNFESKHYKMHVSIGRDSQRTVSSSSFRLSLGTCNP